MYCYFLGGFLGVFFGAPKKLQRKTCHSLFCNLLFATTLVKQHFFPWEKVRLVETRHNRELEPSARNNPLCAGRLGTGMSMVLSS